MTPLVFAVVTIVVLLAACEDGPLEVGRPLLLSNINGQSLPFVAAGVTLDPPPAITEGSVTFLRGGSVERHERLEQWVLTSPTDSTLLVNDWTQGGRYQWQPDRIIITYPGWAPGSIGAPQAVETLYVSDRGLTLRQTGFAPPLDSMIRAYAPGRRDRLFVLPFSFPL